MLRTSNMQRIFLISTEKTRSRERTSQNGPTFRIISVICMTKRLPLAMSFAEMQQMNLQRALLEKYIDEVNLNDDKDAWFSRIKSICEPCGCTPNVKEYKQNPDNFKGHVGDVSTIIRVALTGRTNTPDLFSITALLGEKRVKERLTKALEYYKENK